MRSLILALLIMLVAGSGAVFFAAGGSEETETLASNSSPLDEDYDYYILDMHTTRFGSDGRPMSQLQAERVTYYPDGDRTELQAPAFKTFGTESDEWQASADAGTLAPDPERGEDRLELTGSVQLYKPLDAGNFADVRTSSLTVFIDSEEARSTAPVTLQMRGSSMNGAGMYARLTENSFHLDDGKGTHDPEARP